MFAGFECSSGLSSSSSLLNEDTTEMEEEKPFHAYEAEANERRMWSAVFRISVPVDGFGFLSKAAERAWCEG